ncbi:ring-hydroxylating oxygenase subunit alpha [Mycobacterium sp. 852002-50816_SCH5313054-b]|uniref:aromatic ring-hydroxylating oxygenase subunit alpha n=1 Tax=Mycobacterium sp. 852002-50816_SCH5313054-b TaxID=1834092 RepID=UPI0008023CCF|nr:SRPBCC family protein [Mycobacterium sp. 852002-50816_SCH5313054-b]OBF54820.1 ring-hydroxylating oxygenase subunit alpha [Mycobacterium sp. 852002-50816_SCH5313054-b]
MSLPTKSVLADDVQIVRRVLAHIDAGTTDEGAAWREPVENYLSASRFAAELRLLRAMPSVFVPSATIPAPGDHVERVAFGVPLFAVRGHDQRARVFRNACRHRGFALVEEPGCSHALVCRYHGWTYRLDGSLAHVPHAEAFPGLDEAGRGLVEVPSREVDGLIVIDPLDPPGLDDDDSMAALTDGSPWRDKLLPAQRLVYSDSTVRAMNWKVLVEQFLEGYHLRSTHRDTFYPVQYDDLNVVETFGPNSRLTFPYRNIERLRDRPESTWNVDARITYVYQLFPNVMVATFPGVVSVVVIDPLDVERTTVSTYSMVKPEVAERASLDPSRRLVGAGSFIERGLTEDNEMSTGVQRGLHSGANEFVEFGRHESAIGHFHATLDERLARLVTATAF